MAQFDALLERRIEEQNRAQFNAGLVAAAIVNAAPFREKGSEPVDPIDFVPDYARRRREATKPQTVEQQIAILTSILGCGPTKEAN
jgi:hypothetical protein